MTYPLGIHLDEIHKMNIIPQAWLLHIYSQNYHAVSFSYIACFRSEFCDGSRVFYDQGTESSCDMAKVHYFGRSTESGN